MKGIIPSVAALVLAFSGLAFTAPAQADNGLTVIYSNHGYGHYTGHRPWYGRSCAVSPRHHHYRYNDDYGYRKHDSRHDKHAWRDRDHGSHNKRDDGRRSHGYAQINRH